MLKGIKTIALFFVLCGVLTGFVAEQLAIFQHSDLITLKASSDEKKDNSESKKLGKDDHLHPEDMPAHASELLSDTTFRNLLNSEFDILCSGSYISILTPPPERV